MTNPIPPEDVRLVRRDGTEIPLECRYDGLDAAGQHRWIAVTPLGFEIESGMRVTMRMLPAKTSVAVDFQP